MFERHGCVHTDRDDADDGTDAQQRVNPLQNSPKLLFDIIKWYLKLAL